MNFPEKPTDSTFFVDEAFLLSEDDKEQINQISRLLFEEARIPIHVVTIDSLAKQNADYISIESYARELFNDWGIGHPSRNYGMLLLVSKVDRQARIELGGAWSHEHDSSAQYLMDKVIVPRFKEGRFSEGISEGVLGLNAMGRGLELPSPYYPWWFMLSLVGLVILSICVSISLIRSGKKGLGWFVLIGGLMVLWFIIELLLDSDNSEGFNGGFSGGGGATGSW